MQKIKLLVCAAAILATAFGSNAQTFRKGDIVVDANIGFGIAQKAQSDKYSEEKETFVINKTTKPLFTQRIGVEFGVYNFNEKSSLGIGFSFDNSVGFTNAVAYGNYDYSYTITSYSPSTTSGGRYHWNSNTRKEKRNGTGSALAKTTIEDLSAQLRVVYHYQFIDKLDTYLGIGFGISRVQYLYSDFSHEEGFTKKTEKFNSNDHSYQLAYTIDDLAHTEWENATDSRYSVAAYVGGRYYLTDNWGIQTEVGLPNLTLKSKRNNYSFLSVGASYKF